MAKLGEANIGGRMVPAWLLNLTAEELDSLKSRGYSNPNLLDNWYFANPVNQRGQTSYTGEIYGIDRWCGRYGGDMTAVIRDGYIEISRPNYAAHFRQYSDMSLAGKTVTLSALCSKINMFFDSTANGVDYTGVKNKVLTGSDELSMLTFTLTVPNDSTGFCIALTTAETNQPGKIAAVKLELGDHQTLAHQDADGNWVLNEIPDYGEQLRRCQRYFRRIFPSEYQGFARGCAYDASNVSVLIPFETMRTSPSVNFDHAAGIFISNIALGDFFGLSFSQIWVTPESIVFKVTREQSFVDGREYILRGGGNGYIDINADL